MSQRRNQGSLTLDLQVECDLVWPPGVGGHTAVIPRVLCFHCTNDEASITVEATAAVHCDRRGGPVGAGETKRRTSLRFYKNACFVCSSAAEMFWTYFPLSHLMVGRGSPTALHGTTMSFIQGVVTVPLKVKILAGAESSTTQQTSNI